VVPEFGALAGLAAVCGALFPDLDAVVGVHRKTLHFPVYYWLAALPAVAVAVLVPGPATVAVAVFFAAAALHAASDVFGGTDDARPWTGTSTRAVYVHALGRWVEPRRFVRYDGAPEDFVVGVALSIPGLLWFDGPVRGCLLVGLALAAVYTAFRRQIPDLLGV
jgi:hypothetical protein